MRSRLHYVTSQNSATFIVTAMKIQSLRIIPTGLLDEIETAQLNQERNSIAIAKHCEQQFYEYMQRHGFRFRRHNTS
jgi:hypothetical protein